MRWLNRRNVQLWQAGVVVAIAILLLIGVSTIIAAIVAWTSGWNQTDRLTALGAIFSAGALLLALTAGVVATLAYGVAIEQPAVRPLLLFPGSDINRPVLDIDRGASERADAPGLVVLGSNQVYCQIRLDNSRSAFTARNPVVRIEFMNLWNVSSVGTWLPSTPVTPGARIALRWSGGLDGSVHGFDIADLPTLPFTGMTAGRDGTHTLIVEVLAEGYRRRDEIPVELRWPSN